MRKKDIKSWKDVSLEQLQEIEGLPKYDDDIDYIVDYLSILLDKDPAEVEDMPMVDIMAEFKKWDFVNTLPKEEKVEIIKINGKRYGLMDLSKMNMGQLVDIEEYVKDGIMKNLHNILHVIYLPVEKYNIFTKKYTVAKYEPDNERKQAFLTLSMDILYPALLFFYHIVKLYLKNTVSSSQEKMMQEKIKELMKISQEQSETAEQTQSTK